jgi:hypothetical protein
MAQGRKRRAWQILEKLALSAMVVVVFRYLQYKEIALGITPRPILHSAIWLLFLAIGIAAIWLTPHPVNEPYTWRLRAPRGHGLG